MARIETGETRMRPVWYFWLGSGVLVVGLVLCMLLALFTLSIICLLVMRPGTMGALIAEQWWTEIPWWAPLGAVGGTVSGLKLLTNYDFSYRHRYWLQILALVGGLLLVAWLVTWVGLSARWSRWWRPEIPWEEEELFPGRLQQVWPGCQGNQPDRQPEGLVRSRWLIEGRG